MKSFQQKRIEVSCDTAVRLQLAQDWLLTHATDTEILLIAHSSEAATDLNLRVASATGAWFGIKRVTLNAIASRLAQNALQTSGIATASSLSFTAVVARVIHFLQSEDQLSYFVPVATKPGFPIAVAKILEELRMNEIDPKSLARLERGGKDLSAIASLVAHELTESKLSDRAALFRAAVDSLTSPENNGYVGLPLLVLDIAVGSQLENKLLQELAAHSPDVMVTVPQGDKRTISWLKESLHCERENIVSPNAMNSLTSVKQHIFQESAPPPPPSIRVSGSTTGPASRASALRSSGAFKPKRRKACHSIRWRCCSTLLEITGLTWKRLLLGPRFRLTSCEAQPLQTLLVAQCSRSYLAPLKDYLRNALRSTFHLARCRLLNQTGTEAQWVAPGDELVTNTTANENLDTETEIEDSALVAQPEDSTVIDGALRAPARWEQLLVDSAVIGGKDRWARRLAGLANELRVRIEEAAPEDEARVEAIRRQAGDLEALREYALPLIERLADLPERANWNEWLAHLRELAVNALRNPEGVMATLAELDPMGSVGPVDLYEVQLVLDARLHDLGVKPPRRRYGRVYIGSVDAARGLSFRVVFVPGLAERIFPRKIVEDPILPDVQRKEIELGRLITRRDQLENERLGLRIAVGAARDRVYLSYPRIDVQQSRPRVPSFYALEALRAAEGALPGFEEIASRAESTTRARLGWPAPERPEAAIDEAEYDLALLASLVDAKDEQSTGRAHYLLTANTHLLELCGHAAGAGCGDGLRTMAWWTLMSWPARVWPNTNSRRARSPPQHCKTTPVALIDSFSARSFGLIYVRSPPLSKRSIL